MIWWKCYHTETIAAEVLSAYKIQDSINIRYMYNEHSKDIWDYIQSSFKYLHESGQIQINIWMGGGKNYIQIIYI